MTFRVGTGPASGIKTSSKAEIWTKPAQFKAAQDNFAKQADAFQRAVSGRNKAAMRAEAKKLGAMLVSPHFLYVVERAESDPAIPGAMRLDNYSRATRLSLMLWNTTPNDWLLKAAASGRLTNQEALAAIASQMVHSPHLYDTFLGGLYQVPVMIRAIDSVEASRHVAMAFRR